jgi:hypothetical protein
VSKESLPAFKNFALSIYLKRPKVLTSAQHRTLMALAILCREDFTCDAGNYRIGVLTGGVTERQVSTLLGQLQKLGLIELLESQVWGSRNQVWLVKCLQDFEEGRSGLLPNQDVEMNSNALKVEVQNALGRTAASLNEKSASSNKSKRLKDEKPRVFFNQVLDFAPKFLAEHLTYGTNLEEVCNELSEKFTPEEVANYLKTLNLGEVKPYALFGKVKESLIALSLKAPVRDVEPLKEVSSSIDTNALVDTSKDSPEVWAERRRKTAEAKAKSEEEARKKKELD